MSTSTTWLASMSDSRPERQRIHYVEAVIDHVAHRIQVGLRQPRWGAALST